MALGDYMGASCHACIGGTNVRAEVQKLQMEAPHIIVGTPGRVFDMLNRRYLCECLNFPGLWVTSLSMFSQFFFFFLSIALWWTPCVSSEPGFPVSSAQVVFYFSGLLSGLARGSQAKDQSLYSESRPPISYSLSGKKWKYILPFLNTCWCVCVFFSFVSSQIHQDVCIGWSWWDVKPRVQGPDLWHIPKAQ